MATKSDSLFSKPAANRTSHPVDQTDFFFGERKYFLQVSWLGTRLRGLPSRFQN